MPLYMYQLSSTPEAVAALVRDPQDRTKAVRPAIEALGGKLVAAGYPFGEYDAVVLLLNTRGGWRDYLCAWMLAALS